MRIALNLASRPFADLGPALKRLRIAIGVLALLALAFWFGIHTFHEKAEEARAREHALDGKIAAINQERLGYQRTMQSSENAQLLKHVAALNQLFDEKTFSWTLAMEDLETVLPGGVQAVTLEPIRAKDGTITLHLRVTGPRDKEVELMRNLEHSRHFLLPRIAAESAESTGGPGQKLEPISASNRVNFDLLADYNSAAPAEIPKTHKAEMEDQAKDKPAKAPAARKPALAPPARSAPPEKAAKPAPLSHWSPAPAGSPANNNDSKGPFSGQAHPPQPQRPNSNPAQGGPR
jgi:type IV pilus assembly protein PilN